MFDLLLQQKTKETWKWADAILNNIVKQSFPFLILKQKILVDKRY